MRSAQCGSAYCTYYGSECGELSPPAAIQVYDKVNREELESERCKDTYVFRDSAFEFAYSPLYPSPASIYV
jgi:hypothetical protein